MKAIWRENPRCIYCGQITNITGGKSNRVKPLSATVEHIYPRTDIRRLFPNMDNHIALACRKCNCDKGTENIINIMSAYRSTPKISITNILKYSNRDIPCIQITNNNY